MKGGKWFQRFSGKVASMVSTRMRCHLENNFMEKNNCGTTEISIHKM